MEKGSLNELEIRKEKLKKIKEQVVSYKDRFVRTQRLIEAKHLEDGAMVSICGRVVSKRAFGKLMFLDLYDIDEKLQISISRNELDGNFDFLKQNIDVGDFIGVSGEMYTTKVGEKTVKVKKGEILSKSLRPLPEKYHGVTDIDVKYRQRYLDIISNSEARDAMKIRLKTLQAIKGYLISNQFLEVETPILQTVACGANARPFITKHNALNEDYYLRIAPELYLKQVIGCGFDRVFELGKNFRNEGMDASHLQEFTMLEWYAAYWNYQDNMNFLKKMLASVVSQVRDSLQIDYQGTIIDFSKFENINYVDVISDMLNKNILEFEDTKEIKSILKQNQLFSDDEINNLTSISSAIDLIFKKKVRPFLIQPTFLYNYPAYMIPLARRSDSDNRLTDMFQLVVNGWELVKCYSELVDPEVQRLAFEEQLINKKAGDLEAMDIDEDFILAMEHGMPPMSGLGLGVDRFVALLANQPSLRDVVFFPQMKKSTRIKK